MITLFEVKTVTSRVAVTMRSDGAVCYLKDGVLQTLVDARGRNLGSHVSAAVEILIHEAPGRILVLGFGGGAASTLLHRSGAEVVSVDRDPHAKALAQLFFHAPPNLQVIVCDAADYVDQVPPAVFDGVFIDFQDSADTPAAYLSASFWKSLARTLKPRGTIVVNLTEWVYAGEDWDTFRAALNRGGFDAVALSDVFAEGNRILVSSNMPTEQPSGEPSP